MNTQIPYPDPDIQLQDLCSEKNVIFWELGELFLLLSFYN